MERKKIHTSMDIAVLLAAGTGMRMRPITLKTPKPLVKVHGLPLIETIIQGLLHVSIEEIYIVVGHLKEQFEITRVGLRVHITYKDQVAIFSSLCPPGFRKLNKP